jgi:wobble nucleotide-excising tRNase
MLKRISKINNVGRFKQASCGALQFAPLTMIFGRNTYGKSTLGDIFSSISNNDFNLITSRKTIPEDASPQEVVISFQSDDSENEYSVKFENNKWNPNLTPPQKIAVYDDGFYHNNVFAARQFTRSTKESFSSFVLGRQGVAKAKTIADKNKRKRAATTEKNKIQKSSFSDIENLEAFLKLEPSETLEYLNKKRGEKLKQYEDLNKQKKNKDIILAREIYFPLMWENDFSLIVEELNKCLATSLETHHKDAEKKLTNHIKQHFKNIARAESWIRTGVDQNLGEKCQFCGQKLNESAFALLDIYKQSFDKSFEQHEKNVGTILEQCKTSIIKNRTNDLRVKIEKSLAVFLSYPELLEKIQYSDSCKEFSTLVDTLKEQIEKWDQESQAYQIKVESCITSKLSTPQQAVESAPSESLHVLTNSIFEFVEKINEKGNELNSQIAEFKNSISNDSITEQLSQITKEGKLLARKIKRIELSNQCSDFINLLEEIQKLSEEIPDLQSQLQQDQSQFLTNYFASLNQHFKDFGSNDFKLEVGENRSGHIPIYFLKVRFRNKVISEQELDRVFSESDRRALSLAVFWARLAETPNDELANTIVVLDDPVTSFDNNRISAVHRSIIQLSESANQIVVLSHYEQELSRFLVTYKNSKEISFFSICTTNGESTLCEESINKFIQNDHEKSRESIFEFIEGKINFHKAGDLRIFFEIEISLRFAKQIRENEIVCLNLSDRIDKLEEIGFIGNEVAQKCHIWREALNPNHHTWINADIEDQRNSAKQFIDFVFNDLVPNIT